MSRSTHFGRRVHLPSKIEIKHELMIMTAADALAHSLNKQNCSSEDLSEIMGEMRKKYHIRPQDEMLMIARVERGNRF